jgi:hypothetical protein
VLFSPSIIVLNHSSILPFLLTGLRILSIIGGAMAGGLLLGPVGSMVGGIAGSIIGFIQSDNYDGALLAICKLDDGHKKTLVTRVGQILIASGASAQQLYSPDAFRDALVSFASQPSVRENLWNVCVESLQT